MNVDSTLKALLDKLGVPVARLKYNGRAACFITYQLVVGRDTLFSDDEEGAQEYTYQINIYSKTDSLYRRNASSVERSRSMAHDTV